MHQITNILKTFRNVDYYINLFIFLTRFFYKIRLCELYDRDSKENNYFYYLYLKKLNILNKYEHF